MPFQERKDDGSLLHDKDEDQEDVNRNRPATTAADEETRPPERSKDDTHAELKASSASPEIQSFEIEQEEICREAHYIEKALKYRRGRHVASENAVDVKEIRKQEVMDVDPFEISRDYKNPGNRLETFLG